MAGKKYEVFVQKGKPWYKHVTGILFSQLGLFVLCVIYAVGGACLYIDIERPYEEKLYEVKMNKTKEVDAAIRYLKKIFWHYANNEERYNFTQEQFSEQVRKDMVCTLYYTCTTCSTLDSILFFADVHSTRYNCRYMYEYSTY